MAWNVVASVRDGEGKQSPISFWLDGVLTQAQAESAAQTILEAADALILGKIVSVTMTYAVDISAWTLAASADAQSNREYKGRFMYATANGFYTRVSLPAFDIANVAPNSHTIPNSGAVATFVTAFLAASTTTERAEPLVSLDKAYEVHGQ